MGNTSSHSKRNVCQYDFDCCYNNDIQYIKEMINIIEINSCGGDNGRNLLHVVWKNPTTDITYLLDQIIDFFPEAPAYEGTLQMQITSLDYSSFVVPH